MDANEIRLRCVEAAARNPDPRHPGGFAAGVLAAAQVWEAWIINDAAKTPAPLSLPPGKAAPGKKQPLPDAKVDVLY